MQHGTQAAAEFDSDASDEAEALPVLPPPSLRWRGERRRRIRRVLLAALPALIAATVLAAVLPGRQAWAMGLMALMAVVAAALGANSRSAVRGRVAPPRRAVPGLPEDLLQSLPDPVILLNARREIIAANGAARDVLSIGQLGRDLALSLRHPHVLSAVAAIAEGMAVVSEEITLPLPVPRTFTLHVARMGSNDEGVRVALVFSDQTRAKRAEQSRADFVANATHELRSPLSALIGFIETLRGPAAEDALARDRFLSIMQGEAKRMARLVDDLMSLSRVEINEHVPPRERLQLAELLTSVIDALHVRAQQREMRIELTCPDEIPAVVGDADQLNQVFHNLIDNAVKYGRAGACIGIEVREVERVPGTQAPGLAIAVRDQGEGIAAIHLPRLTERFYRADAGRSRRLGGTGLGLAIVKHIVNRHRGRITIESEVGVGSTVTVYLPAVPALASSGAQRTGEEKQNPGKRAGRHEIVKPM